MPPGPVDALAATNDGAVFLAFNAIDPKRFLVEERARRRAFTEIWRLDEKNTPKQLDASALGKAAIHALAIDASGGLWAGTAIGLFRADPQGQLKLVEATRKKGIRRLVVAPDEEGTVWLGLDRERDEDPIALGYAPSRGTLVALQASAGVAGPVDDMALTARGDLVLRVGNQVLEGQVVSYTLHARPPYGLIAIAAIATAGAAGALLACRARSRARRK